MRQLYVKGFLVTYAKFLHIPPEPLIGQLFPAKPEEPSELITYANNRASIPSVISFRLPERIRLRFAGAFVASLAIAALFVLNPSRFLSKINLPGMAATKLASVTQAKSELPAPKKPSIQAVPLLPTQPLELSMSARSTTWIQVKADGKLISQQRLSRGANERWSAKKKFQVVVSKPSQVDLTLNGQPITPFVLTHHGRLLITHRGVTQLPNDE